MNSTRQPPDQTDLIHGTDWDYLLIADAARFDLTSEIIDEAMTRDVETTAVWSPAINTLAWLVRTWPDEYDLRYVSAHAVVNSQDILSNNSLRRRVKEMGGDATYSPAQHFATIDDVWDWGYDQSIETVPASAVNKRLRAVEDLDDDRRVIGHYVQPHFPWVRGHDWAAEAEVAYPPPQRKSVDPSENTAQPTFSVANVQAKLGEDGVAAAYRDNLAYVLSWIDEVLDDLSGRVIITADHGCYLKDYSYPAESDDPTLHKVPWIEVEV